jgi:hypothetical protein
MEISQYFKASKNLLLISYIKSMDSVEFRGRVECGRRHLWQCHSTDPGFALKTVNPATVFAQGGIFQIIIFHLKGDENHQLFIVDSTPQIDV